MHMLVILHHIINKKKVDRDGCYIENVSAQTYIRSKIDCFNKQSEYVFNNSAQYLSKDI